MKNIICIYILASFIISSYFCFGVVSAQEPKVLTGYVEMVPQSFFGTWRVASKRVDTDNPAYFKEKSIDLWNLSKSFNVITLCNPFNGAKAEIKLDRVGTNYIVFTKTGNYDNKVLTDTVEIMLERDSFSGFNTIKLDTYSNNKIIKSDTAKYSLRGEKIAGDAIMY